MHRLLSTLALIALVLAAPAGLHAETEATEGTTFVQMLHHYEVARLALVNDGTDGVQEAAAKIAELAQGLAEDAGTAGSGLAADQKEKAAELLPQVATAAEALAEAAEIAPQREAFYDLSKLMVRLRGMAEGPLPMVAYCPMAKKSWLQPEGELGNPYYGQAMAQCGEVVDAAQPD